MTGLLDSLEEALQKSITDIVKQHTNGVQLDVERLGGDIYTLAEKLGELMTTLSTIKDIVENLVKQQHEFVSSVNAKGTKLKFPSLVIEPKIGPN